MSLEFTSVWLGASPLVPRQPLQSLSKPMQIQLDRKRRTKCHTSNPAEQLLNRQVFQHPSRAAMLPSSLCTVQHIFCNGKSGVTKMYFESHLHILLHHNRTFKWLLQCILNKLNTEHPVKDFLFLLPVPFLFVYQKLSLPQWHWHQLWQSLNPGSPVLVHSHLNHSSPGHLVLTERF